MTRAPQAVVLTAAAYGLMLGATGVALATTEAPDDTVAVASVEDIAAAGQSAEIDPTPSGQVTSRTASPARSADAEAARHASVAPGQRITFWPTSLVMPSGATAKVDLTSVDTHGALTIPQLPDVGVWNGGAQAGELYGSVVIAGHVDSRTYGLGVFSELRRLSRGDVITLRSGKVHVSYRVYRADQVNQQSLAEDGTIFDQNVPNRLVLITCAGPFDPAKHGYRDNYIVYATPTR